MFLSFVAFILVCFYIGSLIFLLETIILICVLKRKVSLSDCESDVESDSVKKVKKRLSIYRRQRTANFIILVVLSVALIVVGVLGVNFA